MEVSNERSPRTASEEVTSNDMTTKTDGISIILDAYSSVTDRKVVYGYPFETEEQGMHMFNSSRRLHLKESLGSFEVAMEHLKAAMRPHIDIWLTDKNLDSTHAKTLGDTLVEVKSVDTLNLILAGNAFGNEACEEIGRGLQATTSVRVLCLRLDSNEIDASGLKMIVDAIGTLDTLEYLTLGFSRCVLDELSIEHLHGIVGLTKLRGLALLLTCNNITDVGDLGEFINGLPMTLDNLSIMINDNQITDSSFKTFVDHVCSRVPLHKKLNLVVPTKWYSLGETRRLLVKLVLDGHWVDMSFSHAVQILIELSRNDVYVANQLAEKLLTLFSLPMDVTYEMNGWIDPVNLRDPIPSPTDMEPCKLKWPNLRARLDKGGRIVVPDWKLKHLAMLQADGQAIQKYINIHDDNSFASEHVKIVIGWPREVTGKVDLEREILSSTSGTKMDIFTAEPSQSSLYTMLAKTGNAELMDKPLIRAVTDLRWHAVHRKIFRTRLVIFLVELVIICLITIPEPEWAESPSSRTKAYTVIVLFSSAMKFFAEAIEVIQSLQSSAGHVFETGHVNRKELLSQAAVSAVNTARRMSLITGKDNVTHVTSPEARKQPSVHKTRSRSNTAISQVHHMSKRLSLAFTQPGKTFIRKNESQMMQQLQQEDIKRLERIRDIWSYWSEVWNVMDWTRTSCLIIACVLHLTENSNSRIFMSMGTYTHWFSLLYFTLPFKQTGVRVVTLIHVFEDVFTFIIVMMIMVFAGAHTQFLLVGHTTDDGSDGYANIGQVAYTAVCTMLFGFVDRSTVFNAQYPQTTAILFILMTFLVMIVMLNLFVAILSDSYERVQSRSYTELHFTRCKIIDSQTSFIRLFRMVPGLRKSSFYRKHLIEYIPSRLFMIVPSDWQPGDRQQMWQGVLQDMKREVAQSSGELRLSTEHSLGMMQTRITNMEAKIDQMLEAMNKLNGAYYKHRDNRLSHK